MSFPNSQEEHDYNVMCGHAYQHEQLLMKIAQEYGLFCVVCYKENLPLLTFEDYIKQYNDESNKQRNHREG